MGGWGSKRCIIEFPSRPCLALPGSALQVNGMVSTELSLSKIHHSSIVLTKYPSPLPESWPAVGSGHWAVTAGPKTAQPTRQLAQFPLHLPGLMVPRPGGGFHGFHAASCWFWSCFCCFQTAAESELAVPRHGKSRRCLESGGERPGGRNVRQPTPPAGWQRALTLAVSQLNRPISLLQRFAAAR